MRLLKRLRRSGVYVIPILVLMAAAQLRYWDPQFLQTFRLKVFDLYQQTSPREYKPAVHEQTGIRGVKIVDIDEESLQRIGQWPWPRSVIAQMLVNLFEAGARTVAFDVVFAEPDRTAPREVIPVWLGQRKLDLEALPPDWRQFAEAILASVEDPDETLSQVLSQAPVVAGVFMTDDRRNGRRPLKPAGYAVNGDNPDQHLVTFTGAATNLLSIEEAAAGIGVFTFKPDPDNIVRRVQLVLRIPGEGAESKPQDDAFQGIDTTEYFPSLAAEAWRVAQGADTYILQTSNSQDDIAYGENTGLNAVKIGYTVVPVDVQGSVWVHYTPPVPERWIPAWKVLDGEFDPEEVRDQILFVGASAGGLLDLRSTPLSPAAPGVEVHAQVVEQMILGAFLNRPDFMTGAEFLFMLLLGGLLIVLTPRFGALAGATLGAVAVGGAIALSWYLYKGEQILADPLYPALATLAVYLASSLLNYLNTEAERRQVRGAFSQYLSPALVEQLAQEPERLKLGGEMKTMTFLFCDVRGFTSISETFKGNPQGLTQLINRFLTPMTDAILARQGTIDKYMGDCIMAFWNAPLNDEQHAQHACDSALVMFEELDKLNQRLVEEAQLEGRDAKRLNIGIGLNSGDCVVGNMGSEQRFDYSVLGDAVNLASRLEGQSKNYGVGIVIGEDTRALAPEYASLELDLIAVKGKLEAVRIYALLGGPERAKDPGFLELQQKHDAMIAAYRGQRWDEAAAFLAECKAMEPALAELYELYEDRIAEYRESPPGPDWDGVFRATSK